MLKNTMKAKESAIFLLVREPKSGKTQAVEKYMTSDCELISNNQVSDCKTNEEVIKRVMELTKGKDGEVIIDGIFDNFNRQQVTEIVDYLRTLKRKVVIVGNNDEILRISMALKEDYEEDEDDDDEVDFKIIANENHLKWFQVYINYFWTALQSFKGKIQLNTGKYKMNEADVAALVIASRYWGKASKIFKLDDDTNREYFKELTVVFFHKGKPKTDVSELLSLLVIPDWIDMEKLKSYLSVGNKLGFDKDNMKRIINDMKALKQFNMDLFIMGLYGRQLLSDKSKPISKENRKKYFSEMSGVVHSTDFVIIQLITKDREKFIDIYNEMIKELE